MKEMLVPHWAVRIAVRHAGKVYATKGGIEYHQRWVHPLERGLAANMYPHSCSRGGSTPS